MMKNQRISIKFSQLQGIKIDISVLNYKTLLCFNRVAYTSI